MKSDTPAADIGKTAVRARGKFLRVFTLRLGLFLLFSVVVINGINSWLSPGGFNDTALSYSRDVLHGVGGDDSWGPMAAALEYVREPEDKPLYTEIFFGQGVKFQYPPSALFALESMLLFGEDRVRTSDEMVFPGLPPVNDIVGWAFLLIAAASAAALLEAGLRANAGQDYAFDAFAVLRIIFAFGFTLTFYPVVKAFTLGQIQLWINSIFAVVLLLFVLGYRSVSGILMGVICLMKPHYGLFALWGLLNREWRFTVALMVTGAAGLALSIYYYGWLNHLDYLRVLSFMSERGESYYANQSINGLLNRLASLGAPEHYANVKFDAYGFPPYTPWVYWMTIVSSAIILLSASLRKSDTASRAFAFAIVGLSLTIASPIAWEHHYGVFLPVFAFAAGIMAGQPGRLLLLAVSYLLVGHFAPAANLLAHTPFNVLQSYTLAGGLVLLVLMHFHHSRSRLSFHSPIVS